MAGLEDFYSSPARRPASLRPPAPPGSAPPNPEWPSSAASSPSSAPQPTPGSYGSIGNFGHVPEFNDDPKKYVDSDRYAGLSIGLSGLVADNLLSHPFLVLRRQCQVNNAAWRCHRTPFTLMPVLIHLNRCQGVSTLWKGLGSSLTLRGLTLAVEDLTSKFTPWPKEIDGQSSPRMIGQHLMLKAVSLAALTPFYSASLVETVQSEIASESPGIFDFFKEGLSRLACWSAPHSGRMLPVWILLPPTVIYGVANYLIYTSVKGLSLNFIHRFHKRQQKCQGAVSKEGSNLPGTAQYQDQMSSLLGHILADTILYPFETILCRIHLQGCRTIIDNLDTGREVMPIMTRYEGFFDCFSTVLEEEGVSGLFKGFGALVLQYALHYALIRSSASIVAKVAELLQQEREPPSKELLEMMAASAQQQKDKVKEDQQEDTPVTSRDGENNARRRILPTNEDLLVN